MANSSSFLLVLGLFFSVTLLNPISCSGQSLFIFGDSLYDAGNKQYLTADDRVPSNSLPYGKSIGKSTGRWSDGLIIPDYIAEFLDIPHIPPVLDKKANLSYGANFATADATVLGSRPETLSLSDQVMTFMRNKEKWTEKERAEAVYMFYIGSNDYLNYTTIYTNPTPKHQKYFINQVLKEIKKAIAAIHGVGGRKFAFQNLAPLGCLPIVKQLYGNRKQCVELPSNMAEKHNVYLMQTLEKLADTLDGFQYSIFDYFNSVLRRINDPENYRYLTGESACCGLGSHNGFGCGMKKCNVCSHPKEYLFFDGKHNTEAGNEQIAHLMWSAGTGIISPINLRELVVFPLTGTLDVKSNQFEGASNFPFKLVIEEPLGLSI